MMQRSNSASQSPIVSRDRVIDCIRTEIRTAVLVQRRFTVEQLSEQSGVATRTIRTYMANDPSEAREPCLSSALSIAVTLGSRAVQAILYLIGYTGAHPLDETPEVQPAQIVADGLKHFGTIALAAVDNRFDHIEKPNVTVAADELIEMLTPLSSAGQAA